jgi:hypothetical protein
MWPPLQNGPLQHVLAVKAVEIFLQSRTVVQPLSKSILLVRELIRVSTKHAPYPGSVVHIQSPHFLPEQRHDKLAAKPKKIKVHFTSTCYSLQVILRDSRFHWLHKLSPQQYVCSLPHLVLASSLEKHPLDVVLPSLFT